MTLPQFLKWHRCDIVNKASTSLLFPIAILSLLAAQTASAGCPNGNCPRSSGIFSGGTTMTFMKGKNIDSSARTAISNVSGNAVTVGAKTYQTDGDTLIFVDGQQVKIGQLKKGMHVSVKASSLKPTVASSITAVTRN